MLRYNITYIYECKWKISKHSVSSFHKIIAYFIRTMTGFSHNAITRFSQSHGRFSTQLSQTFLRIITIFPLKMTIQFSQNNHTVFSKWFSQHNDTLLTKWSHSVHWRILNFPQVFPAFNLFVQTIYKFTNFRRMKFRPFYGAVPPLIMSTANHILILSFIGTDYPIVPLSLQFFPQNSTCNIDTSTKKSSKLRLAPKLAFTFNRHSSTDLKLFTPSDQKYHLIYRSKFLCTVREVAILTFWRRTFFSNFSTPVFKMWIIQKPNKVALWNKRHFEGKKWGLYSMFKIFSTDICWINIKWGI